MTNTWHETISEKGNLEYKMYKLEQEIARLREALELIAKAKFYFARGEEEKQIRSVCEIAEEALKGMKEEVDKWGFALMPKENFEEIVK